MYDQHMMNSAHTVYEYHEQQKIARTAPANPVRVELSLSDSERQRQTEIKRADREEREKEIQSDRKFQLKTALLSAAAGSVVTLVVERIPAVIRWLCALLR